MASAETARLIASLELQDKFTPGIARADRALTGFESKTTSSFNRVGTSIRGVGNNLRTFATSTVGLLGVGLGIGAVTAGITSAINKTNEFAAATRNFSAITGTSIEQSSKWVDVLDKFGVSGDTAVKTYSRLLVNAEKYGGTVKNATKFQTQFGINLVDNTGHLVGANELLKRSADFFNSNATAAEKATTLTKLYGKGWQTLIPLLKEGRKGIDEEFGSALQLTPKQLANMGKLVKVQRDWNDAIGDLQVSVGVALIPAITDVLSSLTTFLDKNRGAIVEFAQGLVKGAQELGGAIAGLAPIAKGIADAWNSIPPDFRKLLLGGLVANKVLKMTIGFDPIDIGRKVITDALGGIFSRGSPANPMFTKEVGLPGGLDVAGTAGKAGLIATVASVLGGLVAGGAIVAVGGAIANAISPTAATPGSAAFNQAANRRNPFAHMAGGPSDTMAPATIHALADNTKAMTTLFNSAGWKGFEARGPGWRPDLRPVVKMLDQLHRDFLANQKILETSKDPAAIAKAAAAVAADVGKGVGSVGTTKDIIAVLKQQLAATKDPALRRVLTQALARVEKKLPGREWIAEQKAAATKIANSNKSVADKVAGLRGIQERLIAHGDTAAARIVGALINSVVPAINNIRVIAGTALPGILPQGPGPRRNQNAPTPSKPRSGNSADRGQNRGGSLAVNVNVTHNSVTRAAVTHSRMGPTPAEAGAS